MRLHKIQQYFQEYILTHDDEAIKSMLKGIPEAYADAYEARLLEVMEKTFPLLREEIGEDKFDELCIDYLLQNPSHYFSVSKLGEKFSGFLLEDEYKKTAELDWAIHIAIDAADAKPLTQELLQKIPQDKWATIIFELHPSLSLLKNTRVWRKNTQVYYLVILEAEYIFLKAIQDQLPFGEICEKLNEIMPEENVINYAISQLTTWLNDELITGVKFTHELA